MKSDLNQSPLQPRLGFLPMSLARPPKAETHERKQKAGTERTRTRALLAVSHVGSTARRVMVPAVTTCGRMAP